MFATFLYVVTAVVGAICYTAALKYTITRFRRHVGINALMSDLKNHLKHKRIPGAIFVAGVYMDKGSYLGKACHKLIVEGSRGHPAQLLIAHEEAKKKLVVVRDNLNRMETWFLREAILGGTFLVVITLAYLALGNPIVNACLVIIIGHATLISKLVGWMTIDSNRATYEFDVVRDLLDAAIDEKRYGLSQAETPVSPINRLLKSA